MGSFTKNVHQIIDKIHLMYLGLLPTLATIAVYTMHRPSPFLVLIGGTVIVGVYLAVVFSYWRPTPSPGIALLALVDGPLVAAFAQSGQRNLADWAMSSFAIDGLAIWLAILWLAVTTLRPSRGQRIATIAFGLVAVGTVVTVFVPQSGFQSLTNMFWVIIGVAEAVVVRTRLLKQDDVTQATDKSAIFILVFLLIWVVAMIASAAISDV